MNSCFSENDKILIDDVAKPPALIPDYIRPHLSLYKYIIIQHLSINALKFSL